MPKANEKYDAHTRKISLNFIIESSSSITEEQCRRINNLVEIGMRNLLKSCHLEQVRPQVSVLMYGSTPRWLNKHSVTSEDNYIWNGIDCSGIPNLGLAMDELNNHILEMETSNPMRFGELFPIYVFVAANESADDYTVSLAKLTQHYRFKRGIKIAFWLGNSDQIEMMKMITGSIEAVITNDDIGIFRKLIRFIDLPIQDMLLVDEFENRSEAYESVYLESAKETINFRVTTPSGTQVCGEDFVELFRCQFEGCELEAAADVMFAVQTAPLLSRNGLIVINLTGNTVWRVCEIKPDESKTFALYDFEMLIEGDSYCSYSGNKVTIHAEDKAVRISIPVMDDNAIDLYPGEEIQDQNGNTMITCKEIAP
ncbi:MAG: hypothetical protein ACI4S0_01795 [Dorea sp.]